MRVTNFAVAKVFHRLAVTSDGRRRRERVPGEWSYAYQLRAFAAAVRNGAPVLTPAADAVVTMGLLDDIYRAAGPSPRGLS
ncbi:hypothetical protein [Streptomyces litchfieldiae]|uniref:Oxidoreductase n=1 Tax=Streptomyces litchfieldiae TaxID=3075543 RepID=A0ABU2MLR5_9ACTN|nr:hypothetical protein [Streptomyces sp. DSM 44938]MDT0342475.1 hypothetical protein [Streptomyces sp. DSM 44938]